MDALTSMSTVTGYRSVIMAAMALPKFIPMIGTAIGAIRPATFLVLGSGVVGFKPSPRPNALGLLFQVVEVRQEAQKEAESLGAKVVGMNVPQELAKGAGGYARALPPEWIEKEKDY